MEQRTATTVFESLSSGVRLDVFRLLVRMGQEGMVAGDIAAKLGVPPTNLSFHLKALQQAGLIQPEPLGRNIRYRADFEAMRGLVGFLTENCCGGDDALCAPTDAPAKAAGCC